VFAEMGLQVERSCDRSHAENPAPFTVRVHNRDLRHESMVFVPSRRTGTICINTRLAHKLNWLNTSCVVTLDDLMPTHTADRARETRIPM